MRKMGQYRRLRMGTLKGVLKLSRTRSYWSKISGKEKWRRVQVKDWPQGPREGRCNALKVMVEAGKGWHCCFLGTSMSAQPTLGAVHWGVWGRVFHESEECRRLYNGERV